MKDRLDVASNTILSLEVKIRELSKTDNNLAENLRRVRDAAEAELRKYKEESEMEFNRNVSRLLEWIMTRYCHAFGMDGLSEIDG
jgi:hypothetical protein